MTQGRENAAHDGGPIAQEYDVMYRPARPRRKSQDPQRAMIRMWEVEPGLRRVGQAGRDGSKRAKRERTNKTMTHRVPQTVRSSLNVLRSTPHERTPTSARRRAYEYSAWTGRAPCIAHCLA